jgi:hypothetical protein
MFYYLAQAVDTELISASFRHCVLFAASQSPRRNDEGTDVKIKIGYEFCIVMSMATLNIRPRRWYILTLVLAVLFILVERHFLATTRAAFSAKPTSSFPQSSHSQNLPITVVVAAVKEDNMTLLEQESGLRWGDEQIIYVADDPNATHHIPMNKGHEAMVYLSFLIDRYDSLPELIVFMYAGRTSWHNNYLLHLESARMLRRLRRSYVHDNGFVNLRCDASAHCPNVKNATLAGYPASFLTRDRQKDLDAQYAEFHAIWGAIFPGQPVPPSLGTVPGAQFALAHETARKVPLEELKRLSQWIIDVDFDAKKAGAVFEYIWQIIFLGPSNSVLCPMPHECYCSLYEICLQSISSNPEVLMEEATRSGYWRRLHVKPTEEDSISSKSER